MELERLASIVDEKVPSDKKESFHEFLRSFTNRCTNNVYQTKDKTFRKLHALRSNDNIVLLSGDKDSCVVILDKTDYIRKVSELIEKGVSEGVYQYATDDPTHADLVNFRAFVYRYFKDCSFYDKLWTDKNQPGRLFCTAKTHKYSDLSHYRQPQITASD